MNNIFNYGQDVNIKQVLRNKDYRVKLQELLVNRYPEMSIAVAKLNIPGPIKNNDEIIKFFSNELNVFQNHLIDRGILFKIEKDLLQLLTGPERFYLVDANAIVVKALTVEFENSTTARRLFDIDIFSKKGQDIVSVSRIDLGFPERQCFICDDSAKACGRSRKHSLKDLQLYIGDIVNNSNKKAQMDKQINLIADLGVESMLYEVSAWPKPGLVDPVEHGAHPDMNQFLFIDSALSLKSYLKQCSTIGMKYLGSNYQFLFNEIRGYGKLAENKMFDVTCGINTHKGAIFSLGIVTTAVSLLIQKNKLNDMNLQFLIKSMLNNLTYNDFKNLSDKKLTAGEIQYKKYKLGGIRLEAESGYPTVFNYGLKTYRSLSNSSLNDRLVTTLMTIARHISDSNLVKRAGSPSIMEWKNEQIDKFFDLGAMTTLEGQEFLTFLQTEFSKKHLSLGGSADLLILTIFIDKVEKMVKNEF